MYGDTSVFSTYFLPRVQPKRIGFLFSVNVYKLLKHVGHFVTLQHEMSRNVPSLLLQ